MLANAVEAELLHKGNILAQRLFTRWRESSFGPVTLIQNQPQRERAAVQDEAITLYRDGAQGSVALQGIQELARTGT